MRGPQSEADANLPARTPALKKKNGGREPAAVF
jgi:hypothetical protein